MGDVDWYQRAVFYEIFVQAGADSNGDGQGDLRGLVSKLDYFQWLGVDCLWLPPFYDSPRRDGGYDIRDYYAIAPDLGTLDDFTLLLAQAHARGIKVIIDLVLNHTSDTHLWFQQSRQEPSGPYGDFYVWRDTNTGYGDVRVIFHDTEASNWAFDPVRGQYYWHRFYSHQPDLNYDNPAVREAMLDVIRYWLDLGVDGFRLDAITYLFEREGTDCANLPETHEYLKQIRAMVDSDYPGRLLLAEANLPPKELVTYFGDAGTGDECHMAFHFPLMPRLFTAVRQESRKPVTEIMAQTPVLPAGCQWGTFLRNHDELTLEMVEADERHYLIETFAAEPRMRLNHGIRRRLAPLLGNDRDQILLFTCLLLTLPGAPVLYYGDEIGMGDNLWLGDRDGVRTPMQWSHDRNGGFSGCDPAQLYLPANQSAVYGYQAVNVEQQMAQPASLLQWVRRMIDIRKRHPALALGDFEDIGGSNESVLAFVRHTAQDSILCVHNLSAHPQATHLPLAGFTGHEPIELTGGRPFPVVGEQSYLLTLPGHRSFLFRLVPQTAATPSEGEPVSASQHSLNEAGIA